MKQQDQGTGCMEYMTPQRAAGVHAMLTRLFGKCPCEDHARVVELFTIDETRELQQTA